MIHAASDTTPTAPISNVRCQRSTWRICAHATKRKLAGHGVVPFQVDVETGGFRGVARGLPDVCGRARNRGEDRVDHRRRLPRGAVERFQGRADHVADLERAVHALHFECDRHLFDRDNLAHELGEIGDRSAGLARPHLDQGVLLLRGGLVVDIHTDLPVPFQDVARDVREDDERVSRHVDAFNRSLVDVPAEHAVARAKIWIFADPAWAEDLARADFEQAGLRCCTPSRPILSSWHPQPYGFCESVISPGPLYIQGRQGNQRTTAPRPAIWRQPLSHHAAGHSRRIFGCTLRKG